ncbi:NAD-dependent epimerase/dehydratase family protein [Saccharopolyspora sp. 5N708]|uniref:NAD-dependent epimerase/dehydratase family protein n=1 Tax=Saccharopolyspora sp. 5N708 TaxID=3457424 RepID=UPI003FD66E25
MDTPGETPGDTPRTVVTGAAGFIGAHLVAALLADRVPVTAVDRVPRAAAHRLPSDPLLHYYEADIRDTRAIRQLAGGAHTLFHLGANTENRTWAQAARADLDTTVGGTVALLEAVADDPPRTVVMTSSQLVYGPLAESDADESARYPRPVTRFGAGKAAAEAFLSAAAHENGFRAIAARLSNVVGGGMRRGIVHDFVTRLRADPSKLAVLGNGAQTRSFLHVSDCIAALRLLADGDGPSPGFATYDVCNTDATSAADVARMATAEFPGPTGAVVLGAGERGWLGDIPTVRITPQRLWRLGWRPQLDSAGAVGAALRELIAESEVGAHDG